MRLTKEFIRDLVLAKSGITVEEIESNSRKSYILNAKKVISYFCRNYLLDGDTEIMSIIGYTDKQQVGNTKIFSDTNRGLIGYNYKVVSDWISINENLLPSYFKECSDIIKETYTKNKNNKDVKDNITNYIDNLRFNIAYDIHLALSDPLTNYVEPKIERLDDILKGLKLITSNKPLSKKEITLVNFAITNISELLKIKTVKNKIK